MSEPELRVAAVGSDLADTGEAVEQAWSALHDRLEAAPSLVVAAVSELHDVEAVRRHLEAVAPGTPIHGYTSCLGAMTAHGFHSREGWGLALWGLVDEDEILSAYGTGLAPMNAGGRQAGAEAVERALEAAGRPGEVPALVWLASTPGEEERVLAGIESVVGHHVPIIGGSAADNEVAGRWKLFDAHEVLDAGVLVTVLFPSTPVAFSFSAGYSPTEVSGVVTRADGRTVLSIDDRPAAEVYDEWCGGILGDALTTGGGVLGSTTLHPLGRAVGEVAGVPYYQLAHPESVTPERGLRLFAEVQVGEQLVLMTGTKEGLVDRAADVARDALSLAGLDPEDLAGALIQYCAGCMLTVTDRMDDVASELTRALGGRPFLGTFTFGEQGCFLGGENRHGNLMFSAVVFGARGARATIY